MNALRQTALAPGRGPCRLAPVDRYLSTSAIRSWDCHALLAVLTGERIRRVRCQLRYFDRCLTRSDDDGAPDFYETIGRHPLAVRVLPFGK